MQRSEVPHRGERGCDRADPEDRFDVRRHDRPGECRNEGHVAASKYTRGEMQQQDAVYDVEEKLERSDV